MSCQSKPWTPCHYSSSRPQKPAKAAEISHPKNFTTIQLLCARTERFDHPYTNGRQCFGSPLKGLPSVTRLRCEPASVGALIQKGKGWLVCTLWNLHALYWAEGVSNSVETKKSGERPENVGSQFFSETVWLSCSKI